MAKRNEGRRSRKNRNVPVDRNFVPRNVSAGFIKELHQLIDQLDASHGIKGAYLKSECFSKYLDESKVPAAKRKAAAIEKWKAVEANNSKTNVRLFYDEADFGWVRSYKGLSPYETFVRTVRKLIVETIGSCVPYPQIFRGGTHSNGASTRVKRVPGAAIAKLTGQAHVTDSAIKHWLQFAKSGPLCASAWRSAPLASLSQQDLTIVRGSEMFTVPKKDDIDRVACKEPEVNMLLQRSVGKHIRRGLLKRGIDLRDQTRNQRLAKEGSITGELATVDLSSASDSVTEQLVTLLLPFDWTSLLDDLRSKSVDIDGEEHLPNMFSSMGNGFTFELESLLFWALVTAVKRHSHVSGTVSVYGDDIICPTAIVPRLMRTFAWFGFKVNAKKTHYSGAFRESCGKHYHNGTDVSPFYVKGPVTEMSELIRILNRLFEWDSRGIGFLTDPDILSFHLKWSAVVPQCLWGGQDPERTDALVTGHAPRKRLVFRTLSVDVSEEARFRSWFLGVDGRQGGPGYRPPTGDDSPSVVGPFDVDVSRTGTAFYSNQSEWTVRTAWDPWLLQSLGLSCDADSS